MHIKPSARPPNCFPHLKILPILDNLSSKGQPVIQAGGTKKKHAHVTSVCCALRAFLFIFLTPEHERKRCGRLTPEISNANREERGEIFCFFVKGCGAAFEATLILGSACGS